LEQLGIVSVAPGGVRVLPIEEATLEVLGYLLDLGEIQKPELMSQVLDVLAVMTSLSARSAVEDATDKNISEMVSLVDKLVETIEVPERHTELWMELSDKMLSIHKNLVLRLVGNGLKTQFVTSGTNLDFEPALSPLELRKSLKRLRNAVLARDQEAVRDSIIQHFQTIKAGLSESASKYYHASDTDISHA
jgi:DNA-binding FadR family transcriptional regulator